jgi:DNA-binding MarR family transcriptional regulator
MKKYMSLLEYRMQYPNQQGYIEFRLYNEKDLLSVIRRRQRKRKAETMGRPRHIMELAQSEQTVLQALYEHGPQLSKDIAKEIGVGHSRANYLLNNLLLEGSVAIMKRGKPQRRYWILSQDAPEDAITQA